MLQHADAAGVLEQLFLNCHGDVVPLAADEAAAQRRLIFPILQSGPGVWTCRPRHGLQERTSIVPAWARDFSAGRPTRTAVTST